MSNTPNPAPAPTETSKTPKKRSRRGLIVVATVALVLLLGGGGAAYWMLAGGKADEAADAHEATEELPSGTAVALEPFVVNLADPGGSHFLRVSLSLIVEDEAHAAEMGESELVKMRVRSAILELLALQTAERLITPEGKAELKKAIADASSKSIPGLHISDVLFSEFVVQF